MKQLLSLRLLAVLALGALLFTVTMASERTAASMATAANRFLESLTPEQRQQAAFPFDGS
jgi:hypothetical protein